ncbi:MAG TPA: DUF2961 domain-containing protein [Phycisphaerae bacterium]|nr:DUF2961 domain-containing protein [Phycisphaerae bacterium]HRW52280.1 DUF2961 domain-containing protein [Phycisphaerae bacterium]
MIVSVITLGFFAMAPAASDGNIPKVTYESLLREMGDAEAIARWPEPAYRCAQASSYDRDARSPTENWFANTDRGQFLRSEEKEGRTEWVLMDAEGPGAVVRFWSANPWDAGVVRIYLDNADTPVIETPMEDLLGGTWRIGAPLSAIRSRGWNLYLPIPYARHCRITADKRDFYYQVNYRTYTEPAEVETFSLPVFERGRGALRSAVETLSSVGLTSSGPRLPHVSDARTLNPGESLTLEPQTGPGVIKSLTVRLGAENMDEASRKLVLRASFDGEETIWCPVGQFFGAGLGAHPYQSWRSSVSEGGVMRSDWPMPFSKDARLTLENLGDAPVDVDARATVGHWDWDERSMYLNATWRSQFPVKTAEKSDWNYVEIQGRGVFAGDVLSVGNPSTAWWGEGDEKIYVDGETFPSHFGTGTEDYYGYAWCDWHVFDAPFHAQPRVDGPVNFGNTTVLRTRALDAIPFTTSLKFDMEIWHWRKVEMAYAVATFFYAGAGASNNRVADRKPQSLDVPKIDPPLKLANAIEAESMEIVARPADAGVRVEGNWHDCEWSGDAQLWIGLPRIGDAVTLRGATPMTGRFRVILRASRYPDYGIIAVSSHGKRLGETIDLWREKGLKHTGPIDLGEVEFRNERPEFRIEVVGGNPEAKNSGTFVGVDCFVLQRVPAEI